MEDNSLPVSALAIVFWAAAGLLVYTQLGYPRRWRGRGVVEYGRARRPPPEAAGAERLSVSLIVAAHDEGTVIAAKVADALALRWPRERLEVIVCSDGSAAG